MEIKLATVKERKQPGPNKIKGEIYKWMDSSQVCVGKITEAFNGVMRGGVVAAEYKT